MRTRYKTSSAWHAKPRCPIPEWDQEYVKIVLPSDPFELAAMHKRLVIAHRLTDANVVLAKLCEMAKRPAAKEVASHPFVDQKPLPGIPIVL